MSRILFDAFDGAALIPGVGPAGAATFVLDLEDARVTFEFATNIQKSWNGYETRESKWAGPRLSFDTSAFLVDADDRTVRAALVAAASAGLPFLLGLSHEGVTIQTDSIGTNIDVGSTTYLDWALAGQRVVIRGLDGTVVSAVVQSASGTAISIDVVAGSSGRAGGVIMPALAIYLDTQQTFQRAPISVEHWSLKATAALFGFAGVDTLGAGATLTTFDGMYVFDRALEVQDASADTMNSLGEVIDLGGLVTAAGGASVPDWGREIRYEGLLGADLQWFKAFIYSTRGPALPFLLPSWRADLVLISKIDNATLKVDKASGTPMTWFLSSLAHKRLQVVQTDGSRVYGKISTMTDNGDGTVTIALTSSVVTGTPARISWLEQVRFESDQFQLAVAGGLFSVTTQARVVQR